MLKKTLGIVVLAGLVLFGLIQLVPYGREHTNPPIVQEPNWDSPQTRALAQRACFDCHSNETVWPWYSHIAPVSWLVQRDVNEGRENMNFSNWGDYSVRTDKVIRQIQEGKMPPRFYLPLHPEARLSAEEQAALIAGLRRSLD